MPVNELPMPNEGGKEPPRNPPEVPMTPNTCVDNEEALGLRVGVRVALGVRVRLGVRVALAVLVVDGVRVELGVRVALAVLVVDGVRVAVLLGV